MVELGDMVGDVVVVDGGSVDGTLEIVSKFLSDYGLWLLDIFPVY